MDTIIKLKSMPYSLIIVIGYCFILLILLYGLSEENMKPR